MARGFDCFMVHTKIGSNRKVRRLRKAEYKWCYVAGVLALAAESPVRGHLLITERVAAGEEDVAEHAGVSVSVARATMKQLRDLGILHRDEELNCEYVYNFDDHNPTPKNDPTAADRQRKRRAKLKAERDGADPVTPESHRDNRDAVTVSRGEVEGEGKRTEAKASERGGGQNGVDQDIAPDSLPADLADRVAPVLEVLVRAHAERGGTTPTVRGVGLAFAAYPERDHLAVALELEHWAIAGFGMNRDIKDWVRTYRTFLGKAPTGTPSQVAFIGDRPKKRFEAERDPSRFEGAF